MTAAELQATREYLGLTVRWLAEKLVVEERRLMRMEEGQEEIPMFLVSYLDDVYEETKDLVEEMVAQYRREVKSSGGGVVALKTYRVESDYSGKYSARWHRQVCARVAAAVPGLVLIN